MHLEISNEEALRNFLLDIDCLDELLPWTGRFNLFDVLKVSRTEIRHSNVLAWIMDPNENHGVGDLFMRLMMQRLIHNNDDKKYNLFKLLLQDYYSFSVYREWKNIDILLISDDEKTLIAIENKVGSHEHSNQLHRYRNILLNEFPSYEQIYVFLTPEGEPPSDTDNWDVMTYTDVAEVLEDILQREEMKPDVSLLIQNYVATIRRDIVEDQQLIEICNKIYNKHRKALDLIFEHRIDNANLISDTIKRVLKELDAAGQIVYEDNGKSNTFIIFYTPTMDGFLPPLEKATSSYGTNRVYGYCLSIRGTTMKAYYELAGLNVPDQHKEVMDKIIERFKPKDQKNEFRYKRIFSAKTIQLEEANLEESVYAETKMAVQNLLAWENSFVEKMK